MSLGKKNFVKVWIFSFLAYQRRVQFLYETLDTLTEALIAFTVIYS